MAPPSQAIQDFCAEILRLMHIDRSTPERVREIFPAPEFIQGAVTTYKVRWAPGLFESLKSKTPPSVQALKSFKLNIPDLSDKWVVYLVFAERRREDGSLETRIYFGSSVDKDGARSRVRVYLRIKSGDPKTISQTLSPELAAKLREGGWVISQVNIVCATKIPMDTNTIGHAYAHNAMKGVIISVEATLTINFWTFKSLKIGSVTHQELWPISELPYTGLNTHSAFGDMAPVENHFQVISGRELAEQRRDIKIAGQRVENMTEAQVEMRNAMRRNENLNEEEIEKKRACRRVENLSEAQKAARKTNRKKAYEASKKRKEKEEAL